MNKILQQLKYQFNAGGMYIKLLFINTAIFFLFGVFVIVFKLMLWDPAALIDFKDFFSLYSKPIEFILTLGVFSPTCLCIIIFGIYLEICLSYSSSEDFLKKIWGQKECLVLTLLVEYLEE